MKTLIQKILTIPKSYFSFADIRKIAEMEDDSLAVAVSRLLKRGALVSLSKGIYAIDPARVDWEQFAIERYQPSYISFESALARHMVLSQQPASLTMATTKRSKQMHTPNMTITYRHMQSSLFWGYVREGTTQIAEAEKAFLDLLYLSLNGYASFDVEEMNLDLLDMKKVERYAKKFQSKRLENSLKKVM